uniref:Transmembrane protein n=1 Tax=Steinernema glaseri TaxID=37863 RepID=A0A1I7Y1F4_9BILA
MIGRSRLVRYKNLSCAVLPTAFHNGCCRGMAIKWRSPLTAALCWVKYFPSVLSFYVARAAVPVGFFHVAMASDKPRIGQDKWSVSHENLEGEEHVKWKGEARNYEYGESKRVSRPPFSYYYWDWLGLKAV